MGSDSLEYVQIQAPLKAKHRKFTQEDEKPRKKTDAAEAGGMHGGSCLVRFRRFSNAAFWCTFGPRVFALDHPYWVYWASFATPLDLLSPQLHSFSYYLAHHT